MSRLAPRGAIARRTTGLTLAAALATTACADGAVPIAPAGAGARPSAAVGTSQKIPFSNVVFVSCANGGSGEFIEFTGTLNVVSVEGVNPANNAVSFVGEIPQGMTGIGITTGTVYRAPGTSIRVGVLGPALTFTVVGAFRVIGPGDAGGTIQTHDLIHLTRNANGDVTAEFVSGTAECRPA